MWHARHNGKGVRGFTFLELLCVLAVIGILSGLLFPSFTSARRAGARARTKVQFAQWGAAIEAFRREYGYYPTFSADNLVNGAITATEHPFHDVLAGRRRDGSALPAGSPSAMQNSRGIAFHAFGEVELDSTGRLQDAAGHTAIAVLVDRDLDGWIKAGADYATLPAVDELVPGAGDFPAAGIRAGVVFYAAAPGASAARPDFVWSWK